MVQQPRWRSRDQEHVWRSSLGASGVDTPSTDSVVSSSLLEMPVPRNGKFQPDSMFSTTPAPQHYYAPPVTTKPQPAMAAISMLPVPAQPGMAPLTHMPHQQMGYGVRRSAELIAKQQICDDWLLLHVCIGGVGGLQSWPSPQNPQMAMKQYEEEQIVQTMTALVDVQMRQLRKSAMRKRMLMEEMSVWIGLLLDCCCCCCCRSCFPCMCMCIVSWNRLFPMHAAVATESDANKFA